MSDGKRNIQSMMKNQAKNGKRNKSELSGGEFLEPVMQNGPVDYEELLQALNENYSQKEKRYLGEFNQREKVAILFRSNNWKSNKKESFHLAWLAVHTLKKFAASSLF